MTAQAKQTLLSMLRERSFRRGTFTLTSGRESDFFIDCKPTVLSAEGHVLVGHTMLDVIRQRHPEAVAVAGVALGGCSLASAVALTSANDDGVSLDALYVRKKAKEHGTARQIEGASNVPEGSAVVVVEDTITTGGSTLRAIADLEGAGYVVAGVVAIVDRLEGAAEAITNEGHALTRLFTRHDFIPEDAT